MSDQYFAEPAFIICTVNFIKKPLLATMLVLYYCTIDKSDFHASSCQESMQTSKSKKFAPNKNGYVGMGIVGSCPTSYANITAVTNVGHKTRPYDPQSFLFGTIFLLLYTYTPLLVDTITHIERLHLQGQCAPNLQACMQTLRKGGGETYDLQY